MSAKATGHEIGKLTQQDVLHYLQSRDEHDNLLAAAVKMDKVENWVLNALEPQQPIIVREKLAKIATFVISYGNLVEHRGDLLAGIADGSLTTSLTDLLAYLNTSTAFTVMDYLNSRNPSFFQAVVLFAASNAATNTNANVTFRRTKALFANDMIRRIYAPQNVQQTLAALLN